MPAHQNTGHQFAFAEDILIAPNPSSGDVTVELQEIQTVPGVLIVRNAVGQLISHTEIPAGTSSLVVSSNLWPRGIYQMSVRQGTINKTKMLIRE